jgi:hypothetical protein
MTGGMANRAAEKAVENIVSDLSDRSGLSGAWDGIDDETKTVIQNWWIKVVEAAILEERGKW